MKSKRISRLAAVFVALVALGGVKAGATNTPVDATITVTPLANVSLAISPTTYAFGGLAMNSQTVTASTLTLTNNGQVNVTVNKKILTDASGWTGAASVGPDQYVLWVATQVYSSAPLAGDFPSSAQLGAQGNSTQLLGTGGGSPVLTTTGAMASTALWFRLDMPTTTSSAANKVITVEFTGVAL